MEIAVAVALGLLGVVAGWLRCVENNRLTRTGAIIIALIVCLTLANAYLLRASNQKQERLQTDLATALAKTETLILKQYVHLRGGAVWESPLKLPSGAIVELTGFDTPMELSTSWQVVVLQPTASTPASWRVHGGFYGDTGGEMTFTLALRRATSDRGAADGWVIVRGTPSQTQRTE
jgi:hypothetical protein